MAGRSQDFRGGADCPSNHGNIKSCTVEHATCGAKVILHIADDHRSPCGIDRDGFELRIEPDNTAFHVLSRRTCLLC